MSAIHCRDANPLALRTPTIASMRYPDDDYKFFRTWAEGAGVPYAVPIPASSLAQYLAALKAQGKTYSTVEKRCYGVSKYNLDHYPTDAPDADHPPKISADPIVHATLTAKPDASDPQSKPFQFKRQRQIALLPRGVEVILEALRAQDPMPLKAYRDIAIITLQRSAGIKPGALAEMTRDDVLLPGLHGTRPLRVRVRRAGRAAEFVDVEPEANPDLCPLRALREYFAKLGPTAATTPIFRRINRHDKIVGTKKLNVVSLTRILKASITLAGGGVKAISAQSIRLGRVAEVVTTEGREAVASRVGYRLTQHLGDFFEEVEHAGETAIARRTTV